MNVSKHMSDNERLEIQNIHGDLERNQCLFIGEHEEQVNLFFQNLNHLKQFAKQLNAQIEELEK